MRKLELSSEDLKKLNSKKGLIALLSKEPLNIQKAIRYVNYEKKLKKLQVELIKLQSWVIANNEKVIILFEGRDAAGKGGAIRRITENINPRFIKIVSLPRPTEIELSQWYFQRYINYFPYAGQMVFFDRSWYNRAVVEPVNGFCTEKEYEVFMRNVNEFESMITQSGIRLIKLYFSINKKEQAKRFEEIKSDPLKQWKMTTVDSQAQELWDDYTLYKNEMFKKTNVEAAPWKIIRGNRKIYARIDAIKYILDTIPYDKNIDV